MPDFQQAVGGGRAIVEGVEVHIAVDLLLVERLDGAGDGGKRDTGVDALGLGHQQQVQGIMRCSWTQFGKTAPQERGDPGVRSQRNQRGRCRGLLLPVGIEEVQRGHDAPTPFAGYMQGCGKTLRKWVRGGNGARPRVDFQVGLGVAPAAAWGLGSWFGQHDPEHGEIVLAPVPFVSTDLEPVVGRSRADLDAGDRGQDVRFVMG